MYRARHRLTDELFAIKRSRQRFSSRSHRESCLHEMAAVAALPQHPHLMSQYRAWQQDGHFYIQMELCENGSLDELLFAVRLGPRCRQEESTDILNLCTARALVL